MQGAGLCMQSKTFIDVCEELKIKYVVTMHGLICLDESVFAPSWDKEHEKEVVLDCEKEAYLLP